MTLVTVLAGALTMADAGVPASTGDADGNLTAFVGLTGLVLTGFLLLARLSQQIVDDGATVVDDGATVVGDGATDVGDRAKGDAERTSADANATDRPDGDLTDDDPAGAKSATAVPVDDGPGDRQPSARPSGREVESAAAAAAERSVPDRSDEAADSRSLSPGALLVNVALTQGLFGALLVGGAVYFGVPADALGIAGDGLSTGLPALGVGVAFGVALWVGNELASSVAAGVGADYDEGLRQLLAPEGTRAWALLLGATLPVIAVVEELIFRAAAIGATGAAFPTSVWALAVVSSAAFALGHGAQGRVGIAVTGALGFALAAGFVLTNSLLVVAVAHYLVNALEFVVHEGLELPDPVWE